ncbi:MAG: hypothetical protein NUV50_09510, partial [Rhodospirillales bacterium]|nr:hypothetical protein [Rhodospirillales bacterium]
MTMQDSNKYLVKFAAFFIVVFILMLGLESAAFVTFYAYNSYKNPSLSLMQVLHSTWTTTGFFYHIKESSKGKTANKFMPDNILGYRLRPNYEYLTIDPLTGADIRPLRTNRFGFISNSNTPDTDAEITHNTINIFLTGGSTIQGSGATANSKTIAAQLEKMLNTRLEPPGYRRERAIHVINAGVAGYNATQELIYMAVELQYLAPSIFIMINGINENTEFGKTQGRAYHQTGMLATPELDKLPLPILPAFQWVTIRLLAKIGPLPSSNTDIGTVQEPQIAFKSLVERYMGIIKSAYGIARSTDSAFVYMLEPTSGTGHHPFTEDELERRNALIVDPETQWAPYVTRNSDFYDDVRLQIMAIKGDLPQGHFIDGSALFDAVSDDVYWDPRHYTDLGQEIIAKKLYEVLTARFSDKLYTYVGKTSASA